MPDVSIILSASAAACLSSSQVKSTQPYSSHPSNTKIPAGRGSSTRARKWTDDPRRGSRQSRPIETDPNVPPPARCCFIISRCWCWCCCFCSVRAFFKRRGSPHCFRPAEPPLASACHARGALRLCSDRLGSPGPLRRPAHRRMIL